MSVATKANPTELVTRVLEEGGIVSTRYVELKTGLPVSKVTEALAALEGQKKVKHPRGSLVVGSRKNYWELAEDK